MGVRRSAITFLITLMVLCLIGPAFSAASTVFFYRGTALYGVTRELPEITPGALLDALFAGPNAVEQSNGITSAIPEGTFLISTSWQGDKLIVDVSREYLDAGTSDEQIELMARQLFATLHAFPNAGVRVTVEGVDLTQFIKPAIMTERSPEAGLLTQPMGLSGRKITLSPGHGRYWNGSGWYYMRSQYCGYEEEDLRNLKNSIYLRAYLENHGALVYMCRQNNMNYGNSPYDGNRPWWQMAAAYWIKQAGYPCSVYANSSGDCTLGAGGSESSDDIRARPLMSDYENTDIYISLHTNGYQGDCTGACPTGTDTYYDASAEHAPWATVSQQLANAVHPNVISAINTAMPEISPDWSSHGVGIRDSAGAYGEIRIPDRAAILIELGFHDTCDRDAPLMNDNFFRSAAMWGVYKGICEYFGDSPTPMYNSQLISDDIPTNLNQGEVRTVHVTFRNKGILWQSSRNFRLGAVGDSDPFTSFNRVNMPVSEVAPNGDCTFTFNLTAPSTPGLYTTEWRMVRDGFTWFGETLTRQIQVGPTAPDTEPPSVPQNLQARIGGQTSINLTWSASADNIGVTGYEIFRDGSLAGTSTGTSYSDTGLAPGTAHTYQVRAYDAAGNRSGFSNIARQGTYITVFSDGFDGSLANWTLDTAVSGNSDLQYSTAQNHGTLTGPGSAYAAPGGAHFMYHYLDPSSPSLTAGGFRNGKLTCWFYDTQGAAPGMRAAMRVYFYNPSGSWTCILWVGVYNGNPPNLASNYIAGVWNGTWTYYDLGTRSVAWHKFTIEILPYTGSIDLIFTRDDTTVVTVSQPAPLATAVARRIYMGYNYDPSYAHYYDDIMFEASPPAGPSGLSGTAVSESSIVWSFTDNADNEIGFRIYPPSGPMTVQREEMNVSSVTETGLLPNTTYTRKVLAYNGSLEGPASDTAVCTTLSMPPGPSTVSCTRSTGVWYGSGTFDFTAVGGFGSGRVERYRYVWDTNPSHTWDVSEPFWDSGVLSLSCPSTGAYWLHLLGYNSVGQANGNYDFGPYLFDNTPPTMVSVADDGAWTASESELHFLASANDIGSGVSTYEYAIGVSPGGTEVRSWTPIPAADYTAAGLTLSEGQTYYVSVRAIDAAGNTGGAMSTDGIQVAPLAPRISDAKLLAPDAPCRLLGKPVIGVFGGRIYIEESDRSSAIAVVPDLGTADIGDLIDVAGTLSATNVERYIAGDYLKVYSGGSAPDAVYLTPYIRLYDSSVPLIGGSAFGPTPGAAGGIGLNNVGMLVAVSGVVADRDPGSGSFSLNDGSGVLTVLAPGLTLPNNGEFKRVVGIVRLDQDLNPYIAPRMQADIQ